MSFIAAIPFQGLQGLRHLERTLEKQQTLLMNSVTHSRDTKYFEDNISQVKTVEDLMSDRRLLRVALKAFGLQDDIGKTFFIKKILSSDTQDKKSLANRLNDKRYQKITKAFGFGDLNTPEGKTAETDFAKKSLSCTEKRNLRSLSGNKIMTYAWPLMPNGPLPAYSPRELTKMGKKNLKILIGIRSLEINPYELFLKQL